MPASDTEPAVPQTPPARRRWYRRFWVIAIVLVIAAVAAILVAASGKEPAGKPKESRIFTLSDLSQYDGKQNRACYVAVSGTVYKIEQGLLWQDGEHTQSEGRAYCGSDMTEVIKLSPHGTSKLETLDIVGTLQAG
jgi:predicted heme/steroid binding protein